MTLFKRNETHSPSNAQSPSLDDAMHIREKRKPVEYCHRSISGPHFVGSPRATGPSLKPSQWMSYIILSSTALFAVAYVWRFLHSTAQEQLSIPILAIRAFQLTVEIGASFYGFSAIYSSIAYLLTGERREEPSALVEPPPAIGILSLCCDDIDRPALESLLRLEYRGKVFLIIHDDSQSASSQAAVNRIVENLRHRTDFEVLLLRRPEKQGGKAGAVNYVLEQTGHLYSFFLLCDNDTTVLDPRSIEKALPYFRTPEVAIVQCRSVAFDAPEYCPLNRLLCRSVDVFHLFLTVCSRFGWRLFIGHNALLRTDAVLRARGLTPGFFADDLDLAIRLNLAGYSVAYAPSVLIGEKHPPNYDAFRRRTYKWSYGCMQMLKAHAWTILTSPRFSLAEKVSFFNFAGFYVGQTVLLLYLALSFLIAPFYLKDGWSSAYENVIVGTVLIVLIYLPTCVYFFKNKELRASLGSVAMCGLVYGATDFACAAGVWDCLRGKKRKWIPTNAANQETKSLELVIEAVLGLLLLLVPLFVFPPMLYLPCAYIFVGKFLFGPTISLLYRDGGDSEMIVGERQEETA